MAVRLSAPYPAVRLTTTLPSAEFGNIRRPEASILVRRRMTGEPLTYIRSSTRQSITLRFQLTHEKSVELREFIRAFQHLEWKVSIDEDDDTTTIWRAKLTGQTIQQSSQVGEIWNATLILSAEEL